MDFGGDIGIWQRRLAECNEGLERRNATLNAMAIYSCPIIASPNSIARTPGIIVNDPIAQWWMLKIVITTNFPV